MNKEEIKIGSLVRSNPRSYRHKASYDTHTLGIGIIVKVYADGIGRGYPDEISYDVHWTGRACVYYGYVTRELELIP